MNHNITTVIPLIIMMLVLYFAIWTVPSFVLEADAYNADTDEMWDYVMSTRRSQLTYQYLKREGYVKKSVDWEDFDTIFVLTEQICGNYENVSSSLILAMIAQESNFDTNAEYHGAIGLMQLIPIYHEARMKAYLEEGVQPDLDHFRTPRYNIVTGTDYMDYILGETNGDVSYALMWYNQGAVSACEDYTINGYTSYYANNIQRLAAEIRNIIHDDEL